MLQQYLSVLVTFGLVGALVAVMVSLGWLLGPRVQNRAKGEPFECGNPPSGSSWGRFSVKFYMTAILFILFDVEVVFRMREAKLTGSKYSAVFMTSGLFDGQFG